MRCYFLDKACQEFTAVMATWKVPAKDQDNHHSNKGDRGLKLHPYLKSYLQLMSSEEPRAIFLSG